MNEISLIIFILLLVSELTGEYLAMSRTGTLRKSHKREWTYYAMALPFKGMVVTALVETTLSHTAVHVIFPVSGAFLASCGIFIRVWGHLALRGAFSQYVETSEGQTLVHSGLYRKIRHPMYLGSLLLFIGLPLTVAAAWAWIFSALGLVGILIRIQKEETFLKSSLSGYTAYIRQTKRLIPFLF